GGGRFGGADPASARRNATRTMAGFAIGLPCADRALALRAARGLPPWLRRPGLRARRALVRGGLQVELSRRSTRRLRCFTPGPGHGAAPFLSPVPPLRRGCGSSSAPLRPWL